jgi:hypothetical protein
MIIVPTHKRGESPFKHSKTIHVFTSGPLIVTVQIHRRKKTFKGVKMTTAKSTSIHDQEQESRYRAARFNEKGCLQVWGWRCSKDTT